MEDEIIAALRAAGCVFAEDEAQLLISEARSEAELESMVQQRVSGLPLEQIVGWAEFCGLKLTVRPGVFVPRHRTEFLVDQAEALLSPSAVVIDLGCGTGAVGAVLQQRQQITLHAVDIDPAAVESARQNIREFVYEGDLYTPLPKALRKSVDVIVANAPYVPTEAIQFMPPEARLHENRIALDGGADGLDIMRRVVAGAPAWLKPSGHLLIETSDSQAPTVLETMTGQGFHARIKQQDDSTVAIGQLQ